MINVPNISSVDRSAVLGLLAMTSATCVTLTELLLAVVKLFSTYVSSEEQFTGTPLWL